MSGKEPDPAVVEVVQAGLATLRRLDRIVFLAHLMPFLRGLGGAESVMASHMKGARLAFTRPGLLDKLVQGLDKIPMDDRDTKGDVYEYLLSMISSAGENGHAKNNLPDLLARWADRGGAECDNPRTAQSFCVSREDIVAAGYDLSINRYKELVHAEVEHAAPADIIRELRALEYEIAKGLTALEGMLT